MIESLIGNKRKVFTWSRKNENESFFILDLNDVPQHKVHEALVISMI